jgi:Uncharacterised nucleotidyltransferase
VVEAGGCWPNPEQELLLRAALLSGPEAIDAWERWSARVPDIGSLDSGSMRTLPILSANLKKLGVSHPRMAIIRGTYRKAWYQNRLLLHDLERVLSALRVAGVQTMVLKGAALATTVYQDIALRPMNDVDVLVHPDDVGTAIKVLALTGFQPFRPEDSISEERLANRWAAVFLGPRGQMVDLHWHVISDGCEPRADDEFWAGSVPVRIGQEWTLGLNPSDQLFHACAHGVRWNPVPPFRWVTDALMILSSSQVDWDRLTATAERMRVTVRLRHAVEYLETFSPGVVPPDVVPRLASVRTGAWQRREFLLETSPPNSLAKLILHWYRHRRLASSSSVGSLASFPTYLRRVLGLRSVLQLPRYVLRERPLLLARLKSLHSAGPRE